MSCGSTRILMETGSEKQVRPGSKGRDPRVPKQERGIVTRDRIVAAAERCFSEKGYHNTNSKEIAAAAGVAVGTFYGYFKDKKAVFLEVLDRYNRRVMAKLSTPPEPDGRTWESARDLLTHLLENALAAHDLSPRFHKEATAMRYSDPEVEAYFNLEEAETREHMKSLFQSFDQEIRVDDFEAAVVVVHLAIEGVVHSIKMFEGRLPQERLMKSLSEMLFRYLFE